MYLMLVLAVTAGCFRHSFTPAQTSKVRDEQAIKKRRSTLASFYSRRCDAVISTGTPHSMNSLAPALLD